MKWKDRGPAAFVRDKEGKTTLVVPGDWEFESEDEEKKLEEALKKAIEAVVSRDSKK